jgi:hypothetical protein
MKFYANTKLFKIRECFESVEYATDLAKLHFINVNSVLLRYPTFMLTFPYFLINVIFSLRLGPLSLNFLLPPILL